MDTADRTIPATPRRREAARQQGMMPLSSLPAWLAGVLTAVALAPAWAAVTLPAAADMLRRTLGAAGRDAASMPPSRPAIHRPRSAGPRRSSRP